MASQLAGGNSAQERPTSVRYGVLFFLCTLALVLYIVAKFVRRSQGIDLKAVYTEIPVE